MIRFVVCLFMFCATAFTAFGQTSVLRDYVGMISQVFHPDVIEYMQNLKKDYEKAGEKDIVRGIDNYLKGESGTGWVYVARDGKNYILTNYHVISQADSLTITFEKPSADGNVEKTVFSNLSIIAADEDMDIALLAFAGGQNPFKQGLSLLTRAVQDGDTVFSAGFPGLGTTMIWQFGQGVVSNSLIRLPSDEEGEEDKTIGPYIQHTAQIDPGNSGGPLLVQTAGATTGYTVAGINTMTAVRRQAANFAIPANRVQAFIDASLRPPAADQKPLLEARVNSFVEGLKAPKAVYPHIAKYISNTCVGENADFALSEAWEKSPTSVRRRIFYNRPPVSVMTYAVAWTIENNIRDKSGKISIETGSIVPGNDNTFTVSFTINSETIDSVWKNEYGIWRIQSMGSFASGDKTLKAKKAKAKAESERLRSEPFLQIDGGVALFTEEDIDPAFGLNFGIRTSKFTGASFQSFFMEKSLQSGFTFDIFVPIATKTVAFTPFVKGGAGIITLDTKDSVFPFTFYGAIQGGLQFTTAAVPGLFLQGAYIHSFYTVETRTRTTYDTRKDVKVDVGMIYISIGYSF